jgi:DNA polymerase elongation subunit (family B)
MSLNLALTNIYADGRTLYLFHRVNKELKIMKEQTFFPYYYEPSSTGIFKGYNGEKVNKVFVKMPFEIAQKRSLKSMESDIIYTKRYLIDKIDIARCPLRWVMFDIEVQTDEFPDINKANKPVSCIVVYDNYTNQKKTFWLPLFASEYEMINAFIRFIKEIQPDLMIAWNGLNFDYTYLCNRFPDFAQDISPIGQQQYYNKFPAGISIIDYMAWDKKMTYNKRKSYALDYAANEELNTPLNEKISFGKLTEEIRIKCENDIDKMVGIEKKKTYIDLFNDIRIMSKCQWDDMEFNSHIIDQLILQESKKQNIILPKKASYETMEEADDEKFEGAFREAFETGLFNNIGKYDLSGAYLYTIVDLCLDSTNIVASPTTGTVKIEVKDRVTKEVVNTYNVKQNNVALLPALANKLIYEKVKYKDLKKQTDPNSEAYKEIESKYEAIKTIFLSAWGVIGNRGFRLYDNRIASMITGTVRDLVHYVNDELKKEGYKVIYIDTDSVFCDDKGENIAEYLNSIIQKWAKERFNKGSSINFEYEGHFNNLFILAKCHYVGNLKTSKGIKKETKGIEAKRKDSTIFMADFQTKLIDMVLEGRNEVDCRLFIDTKMKEIESRPLKDISFPCRVAVDKVYKNEPIFMRALKYTKEIIPFDKRPGDLFHWIYVESFGKEERQAMRKVKNEQKEVIVKKDKDVIAFDLDNTEHVKNVNWLKMKERNILSKATNIFEAMHWTLKE